MAERAYVIFSLSDLAPTSRQHLKIDYNGIMISGCVAVFVREMCNDY